MDSEDVGRAVGRAFEEAEERARLRDQVTAAEAALQAERQAHADYLAQPTAEPEPEPPAPRPRSMVDRLGWLEDQQPLTAAQALEQGLSLDVLEQLSAAELASLETSDPEAYRRALDRLVS
jgi:hypothetical protein